MVCYPNITESHVTTRGVFTGNYKRGGEIITGDVGASLEKK
jgi:hypothetical protein